ncbi:MAG TPA: TIGR03086 family metal-binding protein [Streptosporangiaceae bacterium]|nr:TIGR03086 family metal-binding protein [Streptosporangiaceae bacterium]
MSPLGRGRQLLESALSYALGGAALDSVALDSVALGTPQLLSRPTPCAEWDLEMLLDHVSESIGMLHEAIAAGGVSAPPRSPGPGPDPAGRLRRQAAGLLGACAAAGAAERRVVIGDRELSASMVAVTGAVEITVHGWDISVACGACRPVPPGLAAILLPIAPLLITPGTRPGLFAGPVRLLGPASPGDQLVAFLGRQPRPPAAPRSRSA